MRGQGLNDLARCELERQSSHHKGIFFEVPFSIFVRMNLPAPAGSYSVGFEPLRLMRRRVRFKNFVTGAI